MVQPRQRFLSKRLQESNYLQAMEGGIDSSHVSFLHRGAMKNDPLLKNAQRSVQYNLQDLQVKFEVVESDGGLLIGARRNAENGHHYWRITQWVMPYFTAIPPRGDYSVGGHFWVPIDDQSCWTWSYNYHPTHDIPEEERAAMEAGHGIHVKLLPGTFTPVQNAANEYLMDRSAQKAGTSFSGIEGIAIQDSSLQESMGPIQDRTREHLVSTDNGIIMARNRLRKAAQALQKGILPPGVQPAAQSVRSAALVLQPDAVFKEAAKEALTARPGVPLTTV